MSKVKSEDTAEKWLDGKLQKPNWKVAPPGPRIWDTQQRGRIHLLTCNPLRQDSPACGELTAKHNENSHNTEMIWGVEGVTALRT